MKSYQERVRYYVNKSNQFHNAIDDMFKPLSKKQISRMNRLGTYSKLLKEYKKIA